MNEELVSLLRKSEQEDHTVCIPKIKGKLSQDGTSVHNLEIYMSVHTIKEALKDEHKKIINNNSGSHLSFTKMYISKA